MNSEASAPSWAAVEGGTILVVEDSGTMLGVLERVLARRGFSVLTATTGRDALELASQHVPDLVLLDIGLPDISGAKVCAEIKSSEALRDVLVLLYSGYSRSSAEHAEGLRAGADGYVVKPFATADLVVRVEAMLRAREMNQAAASYGAQFRAVFESALDAILIVDDERGYVDANPAACELFGLPYGELVRRRIDDFLPERRRAGMDGVWAEFRNAGTYSEELEVRKADGTPVDVELRARANILPGRHLSILRDITQRKRAEEALAQRLRQQALVTELGWQALTGGPLHRLFHDTCAMIVDAFGAEFSELIEAGSDGQLHVRAGSGWESTVDGAVIEGGTRSHAGYTVLTGAPALVDDFAGESRFTLSSLLVNRDVRSGLTVIVRGKDRPFGVLGVFATRPRAFTSGDMILLEAVANVLAEAIDRATAETSLRVSEEQLRQSQKMEAVGRLAGGVAHDFNNLLTVIGGYCDMTMRDLGKDDPLYHNLQEVRDACERATALTRQLLAFSRHQVLEPTVVNLNESLADVSKMLGRLIGEDVQLNIVRGGDLEPVFIDRGQIEQVLVNLAVNARDAMPDGGTLTIETSNIVLDDVVAARLGVTPGPHVLLAVSDTGHGMDEATATRVFEPFFTTKPQGKGTGLGLSTVYGIVHQSGGTIGVYSEIGVGTVFKIYLPMTDRAPGSGRMAMRPSRLPTGHEIVLLVEDEPALRKLAVQTLRDLGYMVIEAANGGEAVLESREHDGPIDLLLTDVIMPRMSGRRLAAELTHERPGLRVLYMSGYSDEAIVHHGILEEGVQLLQKPFSPSELAWRVREAIDARPDQQP